MEIGVIVEGHGEVKAVPLLLRRIAIEALTYDMVVAPPMRVRRGRFAASFDDYETALLFLAARSVDAIIVLLDSDDDCPVELAQELMSRATTCVGHIETRVIAAAKEYECWFLACLTSLRVSRNIKDSAKSLNNADDIRGAKERLEKAMVPPATYSETVDQVSLTSQMNIEEARSNSPSFDKFVRDVLSLLE